MTTIERARAAKYLGQSGVPSKCKACGYFVYRPCRVCKARRIREQMQAGEHVEDEPLRDESNRKRDAERKRAQVERRRLGMSAAEHPNS